MFKEKEKKSSTPKTWYGNRWYLNKKYKLKKIETKGKK